MLETIFTLIGFMTLSIILIFVFYVYFEKLLIKMKIVHDCALYCCENKGEFHEWRYKKKK